MLTLIIKIFIWFVANNTFIVFGWYRIIVGCSYYLLFSLNILMKDYKNLIPILKKIEKLSESKANAY